MDGRPVDLARARRAAKALLGAARAGDRAARERVLGVRPAADPDALRLADAQLAIARELGARSWPALVREAQARAMARDVRARTLVQWATSGRRDEAEALLARDPDLARVALDAALVLGDAQRVTATLARDPGTARRALGLRGWPPLLYVAYSAFLGGERTDGLVACAEALLGAGADPDAAWEDDGRDRMSALHGAAGSPTSRASPPSCSPPAPTPTTGARCAAPPARRTRRAWSCCSTPARACRAPWRWPMPSSAAACARLGCCSDADPGNGASARTRCSGPCAPRRRPRWCGCWWSTAPTSRRRSTGRAARPTPSPCAAAGPTWPSCSPSWAPGDGPTRSTR